jgi:hypothetical protein
MVTKNLVGAAVLIAVLAASGCTGPAGSAGLPAYLDTMCPLNEEVDAFFEVQETEGWPGTVRAAGPMSAAELAAADALDGHRWDPSVASQIPAISASLRASSAFWAAAAKGETPSDTSFAEVVEAGGTARTAVEATLQIEFPQACDER